MSAYDDVRDVYGMRIHIATYSLLGPKDQLVCHFQTYQAAHEMSWHPHNDDNIGIVANYLIDDQLPFSIVLHSVVTDTRANGAGKKKYLRRQLKTSYRLSPQHPSISFHPSPVNRFHATPETVSFHTRTFVKALVRAQLDLESAVVERIPRGLTLPIVKLLRSTQLPCRDL